MAPLHQPARKRADAPAGDLPAPRAGDAGPGLATLADPSRPVDTPPPPRGGVKNAPYLLPHVRALKPSSAIHYGACQGKLVESLRHAGVARVVRYDPRVPAISRRPRGFFDLLISVDLLEHVPEEEIDLVLAEMAALAREALIVVDTRVAKSADGRAAAGTAHGNAWWRERLQSHFAHVEPILVRSRRRAAFKTWPTRRGTRVRLWLNFFGEELRYRLAKLGLIAG